jgi:hypothetical protein
MGLLLTHLMASVVKAGDPAVSVVQLLPVFLGILMVGEWRPIVGASLLTPETLGPKL